MQETFMKAWEYLRKGNQVENVRALLYKMATNLVIDHVRRQKKRQVTSYEDLEEQGFDIEGSEDTKRETEQHFTEQQVMSVLSQIEEPYRTAVIMRYIDELQPAEIAEALGVSTNVTSVRINRGMKKLQSLLLDQNG